MSIAIAFPTLVLDTISVSSTSWEVQVGDKAGSSGLDVWDSRAVIRVSRTITVDTSAAFEQLALPENAARIELVVRRGTGYGRMPKDLTVLSRHAIEPGTATITIEQDIASTHIAGQLFLLTDLVLGESTSSGSPLSPRDAGTRLWHDSLSVPLEHDINRFPTEIGSFARLFPTRQWCHAPWCVRWYSDDPSRDIAGCLRLYLNADRAEHCKQIEACDPVVLEPVLADVMGQVIERVALAEDDCDEGGWPAGSLGDLARQWRQLAFPGLDVSTVTDMRIHHSGEYRASLLAAAELASGLA